MNRKPRKVSKLHGLPPDQGARVDKWLFDKGMTYQQVADGCRKLFGLTISQSSVGRYFSTESRRKMAERAEHKTNRTHTTDAAARMASSERQATHEERWQELLARMTRRALDLATYLTLEWDDEASKEMLRITKVLISARRERTDGILAQLAREKFELWAAKEVYRYYVKTFKPKKKKPSNIELRTVEPRIGSKAWERNERFREEIEQAVEQARASEAIREEYKRKHFDGTWHSEEIRR